MAFGNNEDGDIVGTSEDRITDEHQAVLWTRKIDSLSYGVHNLNGAIEGIGETQHQATDINLDGQILIGNTSFPSFNVLNSNTLYYIKALV